MDQTTEPAEWIRPLVLMLQGGGDNLTDIKMIAEDKALRSLCGLRRIPSESTLGDLLRRAGSDRHTMNGLGEVLRELTRVMLSEGNRTAFTLDVDATIIPADKFDAATAYNGTKGYQPMFGFLAENRWLIYDDFRNGNESPAAGIVQAIRTSQERMPEGTRGANFRSDSAAYNHHVTDYCEAAGIHFAIGADWTHATTQLYNSLKTSDWTPFRASGSGKRLEAAETIHAFDAGKSSFRIIFVRDHNGQRELFPTGREGRVGNLSWLLAQPAPGNDYGSRSQA